MPIKVNLHILLGERKLRAAEVARRTGINKNTLSILYQEKARGVRFDTLERLCKFFKCQVGDLLKYIEK